MSLLRCYSLDSKKSYSESFKPQSTYSEFTLSNYPSEFAKRDDGETLLEVDGVRITPPKIIFKDAFEGRKFREKIVIQNCGKNIAFVRICAPSSCAFKVDVNPRGQNLSPGLKIITNISYTHKYRASAPRTEIPIFVNEKLVKYTVLVTKSEAQVTAVPQTVDFGTVNADRFPVSKTILLKNKGSKGTRFAIDLGPNKLQLIVKPMRGQLEPNSSISLRVEVSACKEGFFSDELWIKCDAPIRIQVFVNFILPELAVFCSNATRDFMFVDFPKTYVGATHTKFLVIKNDSAVAKMFCIRAEIDDATASLLRARQIRQDFKCFNISPIEGRLRPQEGRVIEINFSPKVLMKTGGFECHDSYALCFIRVIQINSGEIKKDIVYHGTEKETELPILSTDYDNDFDSISLSIHASDKSEQFETKRINKTDSSHHKYERVGLYGDFENLDVDIKPYAIDILEIKLKQQENRVLTLKNNSKYLDIVFRYDKRPCIVINPKEVVLKPLQSIEVDVQIIPTKIGPIKEDIVFNLLYHNQPENVDIVIGKKSISVNCNVIATTTFPSQDTVPQTTKEVKTTESNIKIIKSTQIQMLSTGKLLTNDGHLSFRNNVPDTFRSWTSNIPKAKHGTTFSSRPKTTDNTYALSESERQIKKLLTAYYNSYIRRSTSNSVKCWEQTLPDYDVGDGKHLLMERELKYTPVKTKPKNTPPFISLTPTQIYKLKIYPDVINFNKVAKNSHVTKTIRIQNKNSMPIGMLMECRHPSITFKGGPRIVIPAKSEMEVEIKYSATETGRYNIIINSLINENHNFYIAVFVEVIPKYVLINTDKIEFASNDVEPKIVEVFNPLNAPVYCKWVMPTSCFSIYPRSCTIEPKSSFPFLVTYRPHPSAATVIHVILILENNSNITIPISVALTEPTMQFQYKELILDNLPLNVRTRKKFFLRNLSQETVTVTLANPEPRDGIKISPTSAIVHGNSDLIMVVDIKIATCDEFDCIVFFILQKFYQKEIRILGTIDYPDVCIEPKEFHFNKIPVNSISNLPFTIKNYSNTLIKIRFHFENLPDFSISECCTIGQNFTEEQELHLKSKETRNLILEFTPSDMACYSGFLQFRINDAVRTLIEYNKKFFKMKDEQKNFEVNFYKDLVTNPTEPVERISVAGKATYPILVFSCLQFDFNYYPCKYYKAITKRTLEISNVSNDNLELFLKLDDLKENFTFIKNTCNSVSEFCSVKSNQSVAFDIAFHPTAPGIHKAIVPVYVRGHMNDNPYNYVKLCGVFPNSTIEIEEARVCLEPIPLKCFSTKIIKLKTCYHKPDCVFSTKISTENISVSVTNDHSPNTSNYERKYNVIISFSSNCSMNCIEKITFSCSCSSEKTIFLVISTENSVFTTHCFLKANNFKEVNDVFPEFMVTNKNDSTDEAYFENVSNDDTLDSYDALHARSLVYTKVHLNETPYPFFPDDNDTTEYAVYLRETLSVLEKWMYEQCFYYSNFYSIPDGICTLKVTGFGDRKKKPKTVLPFLEFLKNIAGPTFDKTTKRSMVTEEREKIFFIYSTYCDILKTLTSYGAHLAHIHAEYLLEYECYIEYMELIASKQISSITTNHQTILDERRFHLLAKQCWMDLVLQTIKIFVLNRININTNRSEVKYHFHIAPSNVGKRSRRSSKRIIDTESESFLSKFTSSILPDQSIYSITGLMLLSWLEYNFENQRESLWHEHKLKRRHIQHFDKDLKDSIVLASVTATYCPYLVDIFQKMFLTADSYEKQFYNATCLIKAWNCINISFRIYPYQIVEPNRIEMLLLITYLYDYLPTLIPNKTINMKAKHLSSSKETITVKNLSNYSSAYQIKLFGKYTKYIESDVELLIIKPNSENSLTITYNAKKIAHLHATLLFCGDTPNYHYSKSFAISLEGIPDISSVKDTIILQNNLYTIFSETLKFSSPYLEPAVYNIYYSYTMPEDSLIENFPKGLIDYEKYCELALPLGINTGQKKLTCDSNGTAVLPAKCCTLVPMDRQFIIFFLNENLGDFSTRIILAVDQQRTQYETIKVRLPKDFASIKCYCRKGKISKYGIRCSRELILQVPNKNNLMWSAIEQIFFELRVKEDANFWKKYLGTPAGSRLIKYIFSEEKHNAPSIIKHIFNAKVTYRVVPDENPTPPATLPETISVNDVLSEGHFTVRMHVHADQPSDFYFNMVAEDDTDMRYYKVKFLSDTGISTI